MISKEMHKILKNIPHSPNRITLKELREKVNIDVSHMWDMLEDAMACNYIVFASRNPHSNVNMSPFYLTEAGQIEIEEYKRQLGSDRKATWALIIAGLSFVVAIIALFVP